MLKDRRGQCVKAGTRALSEEVFKDPYQGGPVSAMSALRPSGTVNWMQGHRSLSVRNAYTCTSGPSNVDEAGAHEENARVSPAL